jgi:precorrin-6A/cobalt-precorrin-6A reductase
MPRLLILGGTGEALALAERAQRLPGLQVITALAGRTTRPTPPQGELRSGGFGGAGGLAAYLEETSIDLVVDATHPFATQISRHAAAACAQTGRPLLMLVRPPWERAPGDRWIDVDTMAAAAAALAGMVRRAFLTVGRQELDAFAVLEGHWFLVRVIEPPANGLPLRDYALVAARGPFTVEGETRLMREHRIEALVSKNSGGAATYAKIAAARKLALPVVMVRRPRLPEAERVADVAGAMAWIARRLA